MGDGRREERREEEGRGEREGGREGGEGGEGREEKVIKQFWLKIELRNSQQLI